MVPGLVASPTELERLITVRTAECEGIEPVGSDSIIEIDNKSLTHRPDLWGHFGMAREVAAIAHRSLLDPVKLEVLPQGDAPWAVEIAGYAFCSRYSALALEYVQVGPLRLLLLSRLQGIGL